MRWKGEVSKKTKKVPKTRIPRDLTDKDMVKDFVEEETIEAKFERAAKMQEERRKAETTIEPPANLAKAGFTPALLEELGTALTQLKMELALSGVKEYTFKIKKEGQNILLMTKPKK